MHARYQLPCGLSEARPAGFLRALALLCARRVSQSQGSAHDCCRRACSPLDVRCSCGGGGEIYTRTFLSSCGRPEAPSRSLALATCNTLQVMQLCACVLFCVRARALALVCAKFCRCARSENCASFAKGARTRVRPATLLLALAHTVAHAASRRRSVVRALQQTWRQCESPKMSERASQPAR